MITFVERITVFKFHRLGIVFAQYTSFLQLNSVELASGLTAANFFIHERLGSGWLISFVVAATTIANEVNDHIALEFVAVVHRHLGDKQDRFRVIGVNVQDRRMDHLGDISAILGRARIVLSAGSETNLVVNHNVYGTANAITTGLRHLECLHHYALARESRVTVHNDRKHSAAVGIATTILAGTDRTLNHRRYDFQV